MLLRCLNKPGSFTAHYYGEEKKRELHSEDEADAVLRGTPKAANSRIAGIKRTEKQPLADAAVHHLHAAAGGLPQAQHDAAAHDGRRAAAL